MKLIVPKEVVDGESRVGITPDTVPALKKMGFDVVVESNAGLRASFTNEDYKKSGAKISNKASELYKNAFIVVKIQRPQISRKINELKNLKKCNLLTLVYEQKFKNEFNAFIKKCNIKQRHMGVLWAAVNQLRKEDIELEKDTDDEEDEYGEPKPRVKR